MSLDNKWEKITTQRKTGLVCFMIKRKQKSLKGITASLSHSYPPSPYFNKKKKVHSFLNYKRFGILNTS